MTRAWFSLLVLLTTAGLLSLAAEIGTDEPDAAEAAGLVIGEPIREGNLTIFPVSTRTAKLDDRFITLDEGLRTGTVEILEVGAVTGAAGTQANPPALNLPSLGTPGAAPDQTPAAAQEQTAINEPVQQVEQFHLGGNPFGGNDVNRLMVVNRSEKPLYLMPGEVIVGGDQDRTIGRELVIAPTGKPTPISVFCVEHGRWGSRDAQQYAGYLQSDLAHTVRRPASAATASAESVAASVDLDEITSAANSGKFIGSIGSLNKGARLAVQKGDGQGEVWNQVSMNNAAVGVQPLSGAFTANYASEDVMKHLNRYQASLEEPIGETENVVGVIVAVNGKVESMDVFESTPLFQKLWPKLLKSYALDALKADEGRTSHKQLGLAHARHFMNDVAQAGQKKTDAEGQLATTHAENDRVLLFSAHTRDQRGAAREGTTVQSPTFGFDAAAASIADPQAYGGVGGGFGGGVHTSAYSK